MGILIEEMDAAITPVAESASASSHEEEKKAKTPAAEPLASSLQHWMRRQLRLKAD